MQTIADELAKADPNRAAQYERNASVYIEKLEKLRERQQAIFEAAEGQSVILFHEAFDYVAEDYGLSVSYVLDLDEERQVSAGELADVMAAITKDDVQYIFVEELYGKKTAETVKKEADVTVIYLDPLNRGDYEKDSYLEGMSKNLDLLEQSLGKE